MNLRLKFQLARANVKYHGIAAFLRHATSKLSTIDSIQTSVKYQDLMKGARGVYFDNSSVLKALGIPVGKQNYMKVKRFVGTLRERLLPINWDSNLETLAVLYGVARQTDCQAVLEIGTGNGVSASVLGLALKDKKESVVHTFDILSQSGSCIPSSLDGVVLRHIVSPLLGSKEELIQKFIPNPDLIYIDGAHDYINARSDFELAVRLKPKIVILDDIEVTKFFLDVCNHYKLEYFVLLDGRKVVGFVDLRTMSN